MRMWAVWSLEEKLTIPLQVLLIYFKQTERGEKEDNEKNDEKTESHLCVMFEWILRGASYKIVSIMKIFFSEF